MWICGEPKDSVHNKKEVIIKSSVFFFLKKNQNGEYAYLTKIKSITPLLGKTKQLPSFFILRCNLAELP